MCWKYLENILKYSIEIRRKKHFFLQLNVLLVLNLKKTSMLPVDGFYCCINSKFLMLCIFTIIELYFKSNVR